MHRAALLVPLLCLATPAAAAPGRWFLALREALRGDEAPGLRVRLAPPAPAAPLPPVAGPAGRPLVLVDPGHGGHDPGAVAGGTTEKAVTLAAARAIADALLATGRMRVALTRADDRFVALEDRWGIARRLGADLLVSLHADAAADGRGRGATVYTLAPRASDAEAARTERRENAAALAPDPADTVARVLDDLTRRETHAAAEAFADQIVRAAPGRLALRPTPRRAAPLVVLRAPDVPSVLLEMGFLSDAADRAGLASAAGRRAVAETVRLAADRHFARNQAAGIAARR